MMDGRVYEIINLTPEWVSLRDVDGKRVQYIAPTDFELQVLKKEITLYQLAPLQESVASAFRQSIEPRVIVAERKNQYVAGLLKAFSGALPRAASKAEKKRGKPQEVVVDNGLEVANDSIKVAAKVLGISLRFGPPGTPDAKPHIERFFETLNTSFTHTVPGTTFSNPVERGRN